MVSPDGYRLLAQLGTEIESRSQSAQDEAGKREPRTPPSQKRGPGWVGCSQHQGQKEVGWSRTRGWISKADFKAGPEVPLPDSGIKRMVTSKAFCHSPAWECRLITTSPILVGLG